MQPHLRDGVWAAAVFMGAMAAAVGLRVLFDRIERWRLKRRLKHRG